MGLRTYRVQATSVHEQVYCILREEIINLELKPGTAITTQETAKRFGVSRTPVREAFVRLQSEGLLDVIPQRATTVSRIDLDRVYQEQFIRESLEAENLRRFVAMVKESDLAAMEESVQEQMEAVEAQRFVEYKKMDDEFHQMAFCVTGEELSIGILRQTNGHYDRIRLLTTWVEPIARNAVADHGVLVELIRQRDVERAQKLLREHLQKLRMQENILLEKYQDFFRLKQTD